MNKRYWLILLVSSLLVASLILAGCAKTTPTTTTPTKTTTTTTAATTAPAPITAVQLKFNSQAPPTLKSSAIPFQWICTETEKRTEGRVKITLYPANALAAPPEAYDATIKGATDISDGVCSYTPGRFPASAIADLPLGFPGAWVGAHAISDWYLKFKPKEYDQAQVLYLTCNPPALICTTKKPVRTLEDIKGLSIRTPGDVESKMLEALGAIPRPMPIGDIFESLSKGVLDGILISPESFPAFRFQEVINYVTDIGAFAPVTPTYLVMNKTSWGKLSAKDQETLAAVAMEAMDQRGKLQDNDLVSAIQMFKGLPGREIITLSPAETTKWKDKIKVVTDTYISDMQAKGFPGADYVKYLQERIDYWSKQKP